MVRRVLIASLLAVGLVCAGAAPAWAHVSVSPNEAEAGGFTTLTFQVPNEKEDATTTKVQVTFPSDHAIADASVQPVAGWTVDVKKAKLETPVTTDEGDTLDERVDSITWTAATGQAIKPGEFQQFRVSVGLPDAAGALSFPALQTYSDGEVVRWVDPSGPGAPAAEHPAPTLTLTSGGDATTATTQPSTSGSATAAVKTAQDDADSAKTVGIIALIVGVLALIVGGLALSSKRRTA